MSNDTTTPPAPSAAAPARPLTWEELAKAIEALRQPVATNGFFGANALLDAAAAIVRENGPAVEAEVQALRDENRRLRDAATAVGDRLVSVCASGGSMQAFLDAGSMRELVALSAPSAPEER